MTTTPAALSSDVFRLGRTLLETAEKHSSDSPITIVPLTVLLLVAVVVASLLLRRVGGPTRTLWVILVAMVGVLLTSGAWRFFDRAVRSVAGDYPQFQLDRGVWLLPALTYLAIAAAAVAAFVLVPRPVAIALLVAVFAVQGVANWQKADFAPGIWEQLTLDEFYAPDIFSEVRSIIGDGAVVTSVGLHPAVSVYNGLDAADGYAASYPVDYKHRWRALIAPTLDVDEDLRSYFDQWGSRAYLFQPGLKIYPACCDESADPIDLLVETGAFDDLGITHIVSVAQITNADEAGLALLGKATAIGSRYDVWVYGI